MPRTLELHAIYEPNEEPTQIALDLENHNAVFSIIVGLGNGIFEELRVVGDSKESLIDFIYLIKGGGYDSYSKLPPPNKMLYRIGDLCFPSDDPIVFVTTRTRDNDNLDLIEIDNILNKKSPTSVENQIPEKKVVNNLDELRSSSASTEHRPFWKFW